MLGRKRLPNRPVNHGVRLQDIVVQIRERRVEPIDTTMGLMPLLVGICEGEEDHSVSLDAVPPLGTSLVVYKIYPAVSLWNRLVLVAVPLRDREGTIRRGRFCGGRFRLVLRRDTSVRPQT